MHSWRASTSVCQFSIREKNSFYFQDANYAYAAQQGILTKIRGCEHEQASTHLIFASNSSKGQILRAQIGWDHSIPLKFLSFIRTRDLINELPRSPILSSTMNYGYEAVPSQMKLVRRKLPGAPNEKLR